MRSHFKRLVLYAWLQSIRSRLKLKRNIKFMGSIKVVNKTLKGNELISSNGKIMYAKGLNSSYT